MNNDSDESDSDDSSEETLVDDSDLTPHDIPIKTERLVLRNVTREQSCQINGPVGEDIWSKIDRLVIKDNTVEGQSVQINYPTTMEVFKLSLQAQAAAVERADKPASARRKRHDSMDP